MRSIRGVKRPIIVVLMVAVAALPALGGGAGSAVATRRQPLTLSDGRWAGTLHWVANQRGQLANFPLRIENAPVDGSGQVAFIVQGDQVRESTFSMVVGGAVEAVGEDTTTYTGVRTMTYTGTVGGVPEQPCLQGTYAISGTMTANTPIGPITVSLDPGGGYILPVECANMPLQIRAITCDVATGTFAPYFAEENARYRLRLHQQATFVLLRAGDHFTRPEAEGAAMQIQEWVDRLSSEAIESPDILRRLLSEVDRFFGDTFRNEECGRLGAHGATILGDAVRSLTLGFLERHIGPVDLGDLNALIQANRRVGNFSADRDDDPLARRVRNELYAALDDLVDQAVAAENSDLLEDIETVANQNGWRRIAERARDAWGRLNSD